MNFRTLLLTGLVLLAAFSLPAQKAPDKWGFEQKNYLGTQAFMILTSVLRPSPQFYQLNYGRRLSSRDELSVELITWRYWGPLGRPLGPDYDNPASDYPGDVKSKGMGLAYKRILWKGLYAHVHATAFHQKYRNPEGEKIQSGFMLFNTLRLGYHFKILNNRFFLAPSIGATYWPISTNLPDSFQVEEDPFPNYFLGEMGFHVGINF